MESAGQQKRSMPTSENLRATIVLPFLLPTQNRLDAMGLRQRMKLKMFIRDTVCVLTIAQKNSPTPLDARTKQQWMDWLKVEHWAVTHQNGSSLLKLLKLSVERAKKNKP